MEKTMRRKAAADLMAGLIRKGWILAHHAADMTDTLDELIEQNDELRSSIEDAAKHRRNMQRVHRQKVAEIRDRLR